MQKLRQEELKPKAETLDAAYQALDEHILAGMAETDNVKKVMIDYAIITKEEWKRLGMFYPTNDSKRVPGMLEGETFSCEQIEKRCTFGFGRCSVSACSIGTQGIY